VARFSQRSRTVGGCSRVRINSRVPLASCGVLSTRCGPIRDHERGRPIHIPSRILTRRRTGSHQRPITKSLDESELDLVNVVRVPLPCSQALVVRELRSPGRFSGIPSRAVTTIERAHSLHFRSNFEFFYGVTFRGTIPSLQRAFAIEPDHAYPSRWSNPLRSTKDSPGDLDGVRSFAESNWKDSSGPHERLCSTFRRVRLDDESKTALDVECGGCFIAITSLPNPRIATDSTDLSNSFSTTPITILPLYRFTRFRPEHRHYLVKRSVEPNQKDSSSPQDEALSSISTSLVVGIGTASYERKAISAASEDLHLPPEPAERLIDLSTALFLILAAISVILSSAGNPGSRPVSESRSGRSGDFVTVPTIAMQVNELSGFLLATSSWPTEFSSEYIEPSRSLQPPIPPGFIESAILLVADTDRQPLSFPSISMPRYLALVSDLAPYPEPVLGSHAPFELRLTPSILAPFLSPRASSRHVSLPVRQRLLPRTPLSSSPAVPCRLSRT
jgi:hypothetical protein